MAYIKYDDASWHYGDFSDDVPEEYGGTHIALFLKWCFLKGWAGDVFREEYRDEVTEVIDGTMSATDFLFDICDEKLVSDMLSNEGNSFASKYYGKNGLYLEDYFLHFRELMYVGSESDHDFKKFSAILDQRLKSGVLTKSQKRWNFLFWKRKGR